MSNAQAADGWLGALFGSSALRGAQAGMSLALSIVLARVLGPAGYGEYAFVIAAVTLLSIPVQFGLPTLVVREVARYRVSENWRLMRGLLFAANGFVAAFGVLVAALAGAFLWLWPWPAPIPGAATLVLGLALVPVLALSQLRQAALRGLHDVVLGQVPEMLVQPAVFLGLAGAAAFLIALSPRDAVLLHLAAASAAFLFGSFLLMRRLPRQVRRAERAYLWRPWLASALPLALVAGAHIVTTQTDLIMLRFLATPAEVGGYRVAVALATQTVLALGLVNLVFAPRFARIHVERDLASMQRLVTRGAQLAMAGALPFVLVYLFLGGPLLALVFGAEYEAAYGPLAILAAAQLVNATAGTVAVLLNMTGHERDVAGAVILAAIVNVILNAALIPRFGMNGAAVATATSLVLWNVVLIVRVRARLGISSMPVPVRARRGS